MPNLTYLRDGAFIANCERKSAPVLYLCGAGI